MANLAEGEGFLKIEINLNFKIVNFQSFLQKLLKNCDRQSRTLIRRFFGKNYIYLNYSYFTQYLQIFLKVDTRVLMAGTGQPSHL